MEFVGDPVRQAIAWRAVAEFHRRHPAQLWVAEVEDPETDLHVIRTLVTAPGDGRMRADFPLTGRDRVDFFNGSESFEMSHLCEMYLGGFDPKEILNHICWDIGLTEHNHPPLPSTTKATLCYRIIAAILSADMLGRDRWRCTSVVAWAGEGHPASVKELGRAFPGIEATHPQSAELPDLIKHPAFRCWVILRNDEPQVCLSTEAMAYRPGGPPLDMWAPFVATRKPGEARRIMPVVAAIGEFLP
jgi:hypothetical protein